MRKALVSTPPKLLNMSAASFITLLASMRLRSSLCVEGHPAVIEPILHGVGVAVEALRILGEARGELIQGGPDQTRDADTEGDDGGDDYDHGRRPGQPQPLQPVESRLHR